MYHDIPLLSWAEGSTHLQDHPSQEPEQATNAEFPFVVGRDTNVHITHGRIGVTEGNGGDVSEGSFQNRLQFTEFAHKIDYKQTQQDCTEENEPR